MITITGGAGIVSEETFGFYGGAPVQTLVVGFVGIASEETFPQQDGVYIDPLTVPIALYYSYTR